MRVCPPHTDCLLVSMGGFKWKGKKNRRDAHSHMKGCCSVHVKVIELVGVDSVLPPLGS